MTLYEIWLKTTLFLSAGLFAIGVLWKWSSKDFEFGDFVIILIVIMFFMLAMGK